MVKHKDHKGNPTLCQGATVLNWRHGHKAVETSCNCQWMLLNSLSVVFYVLVFGWHGKGDFWKYLSIVYDCFSHLPIVLAIRTFFLYTDRPTPYKSSSQTHHANDKPTMALSQYFGK